MNNNTFIRLYTGALLSLIIFLTVYENRYEWRVIKPKFNTNDCIRATYSNEFETTYEYRTILKVGKTEYQTLWYDHKDNRTYFRSDVKDIWSVDSTYEKVQCPAKITVLR